MFIKIQQKDHTIYGGLFEEKNIDKEIDQLEKITNTPNFWNDRNKSEEIINKLNNLKKKKNNISSLIDDINNNLEIAKYLKEEEDINLKEECENNIETIKEKIEYLEVEFLLNKPYDKKDAIVEIHPGAGGTESCDWANMLYRMYQRWSSKKSFKLEVIDEQQGEEAGIKSVTFIVKGLNAYGYLKNEKGVHRLIRISPFDSGKRRHTSFASIDVIPQFDKDVNVEIEEKDIRIDVYRSSGCGGQGVNTTDSAVRITHLPTKIVVTCQNERSQIKNKETALNILKSKLFQLELQKQQQTLDEFKKDNMDINFGSQIRTYTMCPYTLVKDHRTNTSENNVSKVLDGDIDIFINDNLKGIKNVQKKENK